MILQSFFNTIEFYVILCVVAAAIIAFAALPRRRGEATLHLLAGTLTPTTDTAPAIRLTCRDDGSVTLTRIAVVGVDPSDDNRRGAVSLAVSVAGFDITVQERITPTVGMPDAMCDATFTLDFLGAERYHLHYISDHTGLSAAGYLHVRPGITIAKPLSL